MDIVSLEVAIDLKRKEMYASAEGRELYSPDVVRVSQELDVLLNLYNRFNY
ncbi:Spo0E family sporulation regulatory protein-aspartic acid phosphatase [Paenibacillus farraposensis]|uniref:Spo0E family sporulation regulatory protein-aspartic acid phosphatase n=1 Tax=Paenibacillus farraposensis TaxID=2807095 RepID=A0ABW4DMI5_9BACL|nr:aspartyl-phosphate phosphatase Spo0E family protein [Paenibacillus farraposensis]MCC3378404.1 aspartyl-phosphate phosphatase Spo0E family protein [Paenibacillus farraposensis]